MHIKIYSLYVLVFKFLSILDPEVHHFTVFTFFLDLISTWHIREAYFDVRSGHTVLINTLTVDITTPNYQAEV